MARKKTFTQEELFQATHALMLEVGYEVFSFQVLSKMIDVSRTALYKYYANKDELLQAYLQHELEKVVTQMDSTNWSSDYSEKLSELLDLVFDYAETHAISAEIPSVKWDEVKANEAEVKHLRDLHTRFFGFIQQIIEEGQAKEYLKKEIPSVIIIETIFHSINLPNRTGLLAEQHSHYVKMMLFEGILK